MKQLIKHNRRISLAITLLAMVAVVSAIIFPEAASEILAAVGFTGSAFGGTSLATTVTGPVSVKSTSDANSEHLGRSVSDIITTKKPHATPLDTLVRKLSKKEKVTSFKAEWEEVAVRGAEDTLTGGFTAANGASDESVTLDVTSTEIWAVDDTVSVPSVNGGDGNDLVLHITAVDGDADTITVFAVNGSDSSGEGKRVPSIANGAKLYRLGNSKSELDAQSTVKYQVPVLDYNYCQSFQCQLEEGILESKHKSYSGYNYNDKKMLALYDYRSRMESSHLWGNRRMKLVGDEKHYYAGGIINKVSNGLEFGTGGGAMDISADDVIDICENVFSPNNGSEERYLFAGRTLVSALDKIDTDKRRIESTQTEIVIGMKVKTLISSHGILHVIPNKSLDIQPDFRKKGLILDLGHIVKEQLEETNVTPLELNKSGQRKVKNAMRIDETSCLSVRYAGSGGVHAIISPQA